MNSWDTARRQLAPFDEGNVPSARSRRGNLSTAKLPQITHKPFTSGLGRWGEGVQMSQQPSILCVAPLFRGCWLGEGFIYSSSSALPSNIEWSPHRAW